MTTAKHAGSSRAIKRAIDIAGSLAGLLVLAPVMLGIAVLVARRSGRPVLFPEQRIGRGGKPFMLLKFRTLYPRSSTLRSIAPADDPRITPLGRTLRRTRLDELPQLYNVLVGDMSLVGPRPLVPRHADALDDAARRVILSVRPGVMDPASVLFIAEDAVLAGRPNAEAEYFELLLPAKVEVQLNYLRHWHLALDLRVIMQTVSQLWSAHAREESRQKVRAILAPAGEITPDVSR